MAFIHHPAFQSLFLPVVLGLIGSALVHGLWGSRHAAWGVWLGLIGALAWLPGFDLAPGSGTQKLPWLVLAAVGLAALDSARAEGRRQRLLGWLAALLAWAAGAVWLAAGRTSAPSLGAAVAFGGLVLAMLAGARSDAGETPGAPARPMATLAPAMPGWALVLASLGLAVLAARGASLLLAQLALMLASTLAAGCAWAGRVPGSGLPTGLRLACGLAWLSLAWLWVLAAPAGAAYATGAWAAWPGLESQRAVRVALLALAAVAWVLLARRRKRQARQGWWWWIMLMPAAVALLAVFLPETAGTAPGNGLPAGPDDPYITSTWP